MGLRSANIKPMIISKKQLEENEGKTLAPYAVLSKKSKGRKYADHDDKQRLPFQKDRDRVIHCRAFRRLKDKTQVFVAHHGDHYRNRLSHSLEVAQISKGIARSLGLNEDLAEVIALAHDLGHTPFGHAGEFALHEVLSAYGLEFEHNEQSRRTVEEIEHVYPDFIGLNLSLEVINGLQKHQTSWDNPKKNEAVRPSLEAQVVNMGDEIAYQNHDVDDGLRAGIFEEADLQELTLWQMAAELTDKLYGPIEDAKIRWSRVISKMVGIMITDVCVETDARLAKYEIKTLEDVYACDKSLVGFSPDLTDANRQLKEFLLARFYNHPDTVAPMQKGQETVKRLFKHFMESPLDLPRLLAEKAEQLEESARAELLRDYLAGMTDRFAELAAERLELFSR